MSFWDDKPLSEMTPDEWESLCDGCARCCLLKLECWETGEVQYTSVVCRYLAEDECRCSDYVNRNTMVPTCVHLTVDALPSIDWLPTTCAYRCIAEGRGLPRWHPLVSGEQETVLEAGISIRGRVVSEEFVHPSEVEERVIRWLEV